jgi:DNA-binding NarL/FixJ family response regulator
MDMVCFSSRLDSDRLELTGNPSAFLEDFLQTQWIQPKVCVRIISSSCLLREAVFNLVNSAFQVKQARSPQGWVLFDYGIGRNAVLRAIQVCRSQHPTDYLIVLEVPDDPEVILACMAAGAQAYVLQGAIGSQIIETMQQIDRGVFQCPMAINDRLVERLVQQRQVERPRPALTRREWEVLCCIERGLSDSSIAVELYIGLRTVKHHVHNLLGKLQVQSRWQAAQLARDHGWLEEVRSQSISKSRRMPTRTHPIPPDSN